VEEVFSEICIQNLAQSVVQSPESPVSLGVAGEGWPRHQAVPHKKYEIVHDIEEDIALEDLTANRSRSGQGPPSSGVCGEFSWATWRIDAIECKVAVAIKNL